jgi:hypothetical protein
LGTDAIDQAESELSIALSLGGAAHSMAHFYLALVHIKKGTPEEAKRQLNVLPGEGAERRQSSPRPPTAGKAEAVNLRTSGDLVCKLH